MRAALGLGQDVRGVAALVPMDLPVGHLPRPVGHLVEEPPVVRDDDERTVLEMPGQPGDRLDVEVVGRLVENEKVGLGHEQPGEGDTSPLAAGHALDGCVEGDVGQQPGQDVPGPRVAGPVVLGTVTEHDRPYGGPLRELVALGQKPKPRPPRPGDPPVIRLDPPRQQGDQGGLAVAVTAHDADPVPRGDAERDAVEQRNRPVGLAETFNIDEIHNASKAIRPSPPRVPPSYACGQPRRITRSAIPRRSSIPAANRRPAPPEKIACSMVADRSTPVEVNSG